MEFDSGCLSLSMYVVKLTFLQMKIFYEDHLLSLHLPSSSSSDRRACLCIVRRRISSLSTMRRDEGGGQRPRGTEKERRKHV